jgi:putative flippase GtrA
VPSMSVPEAARPAPRAEGEAGGVTGRATGGVVGGVVGRADIRAQFVWYLVVGGLSFLADLAVFVGLLGLGAPVMAALAFGFVVGTLVNYGLSRALAFTGGRYRRTGEVARLFAVALAGLGLTAVLVALLMALGLTAVAAKIVATPIALVWNYVGRRRFVFHSQMPFATWRLSARAVARIRPGRR